MKAITLWQPYASAIALGYKGIETRSWSTNYRGKLAIHAAKRWTKAEREVVRQAKVELGIEMSDLPLGVIVAVADLVHIEPSEDFWGRVEAQEWYFGDYSSGRYGWVLQNVNALSEPIPAVGKQGLWNLTAEQQAAL